jgi:hypothetical protein
MDFNKRSENAFDRWLAKKPESDRPTSNFLNNQISPENPVRATSAYIPDQVKLLITNKAFCIMQRAKRTVKIRIILVFMV